MPPMFSLTASLFAKRNARQPHQESPAAPPRMEPHNQAPAGVMPSHSAALRSHKSRAAAPLLHLERQHSFREARQQAGASPAVDALSATLGRSMSAHFRRPNLRAVFNAPHPPPAVTVNLGDDEDEATQTFRPQTFRSHARAEEGGRPNAVTLAQMLDSSTIGRVGQRLRIGLTRVEESGETAPLQEAVSAVRAQLAAASGLSDGARHKLEQLLASLEQMPEDASPGVIALVRSNIAELLHSR